jgi:PAS domain S-box-containing protein
MESVAAPDSAQPFSLPDSLYRAVVESSIEAVLITAPDGRILQANPAACRLFGYTAAELVQLGRTGLVDGGDPRLAPALAERARAGSYRGELTFIRKGGHKFPGEFSTAIFRSPDGAEFTSLVIRDITERNHLEAELREREQIYRDLLQSAFDGYVIHQDGRIVNVNEAYAAMFGYSIAELIGRPVLQLVAPDVHPTVSDNIRRGITRPYTTTGLTKSGKRITIEAAARNCEVNGRPARIAAVRDLTERNSLEQQFLRTQRLESIGTLAGGIAHDMNNLLSPIILSIGILEDMALPPEAEQITQTMKRCAHRGSDLIKQVLAFSRGLAGEKTNLNVRHIIVDLQRILADTFPKTIRLEIDAPSDLSLVHADATQISQVLMNLCVNARDAMPSGGTLQLFASNQVIDTSYATMHPGFQPGRYVQIEVSDTGSGMSPAVQERIFEPFYTTKEVGQGTGLGLSTALAIAKSHGGVITVESTEGEGSTFRLFLPATTGPEDTAAPPVLPLPRGRGERVLVVDDEEAIRFVTQQTLEAHGYVVDVAEDGAQGLQKFVQLSPDLVLTDLMMPVMDGTVLIAALRRLSPQVKVIAASGLQTGGKVARVAALEGTAFLAKPYTAESLLVLVRRTLDTPAV